MASDPNYKSRRAFIATGVVVLAVLPACWFAWRTGPPQMGSDEEVFSGVDALFTAVTARDEKLLGQCERRLHALKDAAKLPRKAADYLDGIISQARAGKREAAAQRLYAFMEAQRRGPAKRPPAKKLSQNSPRPPWQRSRV